VYPCRYPGEGGEIKDPRTPHVCFFEAWVLENGKENEGGGYTHKEGKGFASLIGRASMGGMSPRENRIVSLGELSQNGERGRRKNGETCRESIILERSLYGEEGLLSPIKGTEKASTRSGCGIKNVEWKRGAAKFTRMERSHFEKRRTPSPGESTGSTGDQQTTRDVYHGRDFAISTTFASRKREINRTVYSRVRYRP